MFLLFTDIDECEDPSVCPVDLKCNNKNGSFECTCHEGFIRAGNHCIREYINQRCEMINVTPPLAHCDPPCHSEGRCLANNTCMCPGGLTGSRCESGMLSYSCGLLCCCSYSS